MKKDNVVINTEAIENLKFEGTISHDARISGMKNVAEADIRLRSYLSRMVYANPELIKDLDFKLFKIYTHSGRFHPDETFSTAAILLARHTIANNLYNTEVNLEYITNEDILSVVKRVPNLAAIENLDVWNSVVLDLRDGHYDHHHEDPNERKDYPKWAYEPGRFSAPVKMATFGAVWSDIGHIFDLPDIEAPNKNVFEIILKDFILEMDQQDNYGPNYCKSGVSKIISNMNGYSDFENQTNIDSTELDFRFVEAVKMAYVILRNEIFSTQRLVQSVKDVSEKCIFKTIGHSRNTIRYINICDKFVSTEYPIIAVDIAKVPEGENSPNIMIEAVNSTVRTFVPNYISSKDTKEWTKTRDYRTVNPVMLINHNPDMRDGSIRVVLGKYAVLNVQKVKEYLGDKIKFIHPNGGFLCTFESEENLNCFLDMIKNTTDILTVFWDKMCK